jgi:hypothetical protein
MPKIFRIIVAVARTASGPCPHCERERDLYNLRVEMVDGRNIAAIGCLACMTERIESERANVAREELSA